MGLIGLCRTIVRRVRDHLELSKYTPFTRAEYLRRTGAQIGEGCFIVPTELGTEPYLVKIGNHVVIASDVEFATHDGAVWVFRDEVPDIQVFGPIVIEDNCVIGARSIIFPNVRIGRNSIIGAGSVVISDIPANSLAIGVPARVFGSIDRYRQKCLERWAEQRPPDILLENNETWWNSRHYSGNREKLRRHLLKLFEGQLGRTDNPRKEMDKASVARVEI